MPRRDPYSDAASLVLALAEQLERDLVEATYPEQRRSLKTAINKVRQLADKMAHERDTAAAQKARRRAGQDAVPLPKRRVVKKGVTWRAVQRREGMVKLEQD